MRDIAREILKIAKEVIVDARVTFQRDSDIEDSVYTSIHSEMQKMADRIRRNEGIDVIMSRKDTDKFMEIGIGFSDHEAKGAILDEFGALASKLSKRNGIKPVSVVYS